MTIEEALKLPTLLHFTVKDTQVNIVFSNEELVAYFEKDGKYCACQFEIGTNVYEITATARVTIEEYDRGISIL